MSVFVGGRLGKLTQGFLESGIFGGGLGGDIDTSTSIDFTGGGPIAGFQSEHLLDKTRFSVYGKGLVAALTGTFDSHYQMFNRLDRHHARDDQLERRPHRADARIRAGHYVDRPAKSLRGWRSATWPLIGSTS